jgi:hypothetical protein
VNEPIDWAEAKQIWPWLEIKKAAAAPRKSPTAASLTIEELAEAINEAVERYIEPLEARIKELEARPTMKYSGVWNATTRYAAGDVTTFDGSMWICHHDSLGNKPNETRDWQLCVKRGRDAQPRQPMGTAKPR